jgi:hypothetical protein
MASSFHHPATRIRLSIPALAGVLCLLVSACSTTSSKVAETILVESPRGSVSLQNVEESWFKTAHPLFMSPLLLTHILRGVEARALPADKTTARRVFSDGDAEFLSPLISQALVKATKGQIVGFQVLHGMDAGSDSTGGILYIQGQLLHLSLTHYRANIGRREIGAKPDRQLLNPTGLEQRQIGFIPEAAGRSSLNEQPDLVSPPPLATVVIDFELVAKGVEPQSASGQSQPLYLYPDANTVASQFLQSMAPAKSAATAQTAQSEEIRSMKELVMKQATELEGLKEDVRTLQHRLAEIHGEAKKRQSAPPLRKSVP